MHETRFVAIRVRKGHERSRKHETPYSRSMSPRILLVYAGHVGGRTEQLWQALADGVRQCDSGCILTPRHALQANLDDLRQAQGILLSTPEHFGYMAGALKHFFDTTFYPGAEEKEGLPYGLVVSAGNDGRGAIEAVQKIVAGYRWREIAPPIRVVGEPTAPDIVGCRELGATLALGLEAGIF